MKYYYLDLFSGIGGFALGAYWAGIKFDEHYFSEIDGYAIKIYQKRFPDAIPLGDVRNIRGEELPKGRWIITGGFPCQDISVAGNKAGLEGERSGLFSEYIRLIGEIRPAFAIMENVGNLASWFYAGKGRYPLLGTPLDGGEWSVEIDQYQGIARCIGSLSEIGYDSEWAVIRASDVGAPHRRDRFWIVGYPCGGGCGGIARGRAREEPSDGYSQLETRNPDRNTDSINKQEICGGESANSGGIRSDVADSDRLRLEYERKIADGAGEQNIPPQSEGGGTDLADSRCAGIHESGITEAAGRGSGEPGRVYGYGIPGGKEEERKNLADPGSYGLETPGTEQPPTGPLGCCTDNPDTDSKRFQELLDRITAWAGDADSPSCRNGIGNYWAVEPNVGRVAIRVPFRVGRLKGLGNSVVPQIPQLILEEIKEDFYNDQPWVNEQ